MIYQIDEKDIPKKRKNVCEDIDNVATSAEGHNSCRKLFISKLKPIDEKEVEKMYDVIKKCIIQIYYEEIHPVSKNPDAEELFNREQKAMDEYLGRNLKSIEYPILNHKVNTSMAYIYKSICNPKKLDNTIETDQPKWYKDVKK